ncbi:MAG: NAD(P)/FAD-dependent oxidoreductase [Nitratireductor sp.]|nr:NAD(P)/FAD-dependent oxidoreductase [Nitratireductor sp.]MCC0022285.1 NAD(P)/FAD-dependent oxidoreductase [Nitratireductor sp.]
MTVSSKNPDVIVLGAGGAGLMCAAVAGQGGKRVTLVDHAAEPGRKILISGGGRCNFTNLDVGAANYLCANPHFAKSALARYRPSDFIEMVNRHGIAWHEKTLGQLFCDGPAKQIVAMLLEEYAASQRQGGDVDVLLGSTVSAIGHSDGEFRVQLQDGQSLCAPSLVVATGGPSIPKLGATGFAYDIARQFRLKVVEPRPALVPLKLGPDDVLFRELSGVAVPVEARCGKVRFREAALFTHKGLSGPAILQISSYWKPGGEISIDLLPDAAPDWLAQAKRECGGQHLPRVLAGAFPARLAEALAERLVAAGGADGELANISDRKLNEISQRLSNWVFHPTGTEGFAKAEVTLGGVSTAELSSQTMEARNVPGLYFIGECVDVTGWLGGYNFQWAWASAVAAGRALAERPANGLAR